MCNFLSSFVRCSINKCSVCAYEEEKIFKFSRHFYFIFKQLLIFVSIAFALEFMPPHKAKWLVYVRAKK